MHCFFKKNKQSYAVRVLVGTLEDIQHQRQKKIIFKENFLFCLKKFNSVCVSFDQLTALDLTAAQQKQNLWSEKFFFFITDVKVQILYLWWSTDQQWISPLFTVDTSVDITGGLPCFVLIAELAPGHVDWLLARLTGCWPG